MPLYLPTISNKLTAKMAALALLVSDISANETLVDALKASTVNGYFKTMYIQDDRKGVKLDQTTFGIGGKVAVTTGEYQSVKGGIGYYKTDDLGIRSKNQKETDAYMFDVDKKPYYGYGRGFFGVLARRYKIKIRKTRDRYAVYIDL